VSYLRISRKGETRVGRNNGVRQNPESLNKVLSMLAERKPLREIGEAVGVSAERIRQIREKLKEEEKSQSGR
jgi:DNA-directed RNA polymerase sigma subunit (sigma70/sigma32)